MNLLRRLIHAIDRVRDGRVVRAWSAGYAAGHRAGLAAGQNLANLDPDTRGYL